MIFDRGDRVITPGGTGSIIFKRMKPPTFGEVDVYSVRLDSRAKEDPFYSGTIYEAEMVKEEKVCG
jgi:hypothetical protein